MPIVSHMKLASPFKQLISELSRYSTPHRYRKRERWVAALPDFVDVHRSIAQDLHRYVEQPRRNYARPRGAWIRALAPAQAHLLSAANMGSRIALAEIALRHLQQHPELYREPLHFVTVSPAAYFRPLETASRSDLRSLQKLTGQGLAGLSFIGAPDFALLKAWGPSGIRELHNHVGPHTHSVVFGASKAHIEQGLRDAGLGAGGWTGRAAFDIKSISADKLEGYVLYLLKAPLFFYHASAGVRRFRHPETGEAEIHSRFRCHNLRPGDQLRMAAVTHDMYVDELLFGQGSGTTLVRAIRSEAREPIVRLNEAAVRSGRPETSLAVSVRSETRPLLSACIIEPPRLLRLLERRYKVGRRTREIPSSNNGSLNDPHWAARLAAELDDLDD